MKKNIVAQVGIFAALMIVATLLSNYIQFGTISINLALIVIAVGAMKYGPAVGFILGVINGIVIMFAPSTMAFFQLSVIGTILVCTLKASIAGLVSSLLYKAINSKHHKTAVIVSSAIVPILNTAIFILFALVFFKGAFGSLISLFVTANFLVEFIVTIAISFGIIYILK